jgi:hypothetical protein
MGKSPFSYWQEIFGTLDPVAAFQSKRYSEKERLGEVNSYIQWYNWVDEYLLMAYEAIHQNGKF